MAKAVDVKNIRKKIEDAFHQEKIEDEFKNLAGKDDEKHRRFKQILIHLICEKPDINLSTRKERNNLLKDIQGKWKSQENVPSHDDIMKPDELEEYDEDTHGSDNSPEPDGQKDEPEKNSLPDTKVEDESLVNGESENHISHDEPSLPVNLDAQESDPPSITPDQTDAPKKSPVDLVDADDNYIIKKGLALILWNTKFLDAEGGYDKDHSRENIGDEDRDMMGDLFKKYDFDVIGQEEFESRYKGDDKEQKKRENESGGNLLKKEVLEKIEKVKKVIEVKKPDIFVCVVSTHGLESTEVKKEMKASNSQVAHVVRHQLCFKDGLIDQPMFTDELIGAFDDSNCPVMEGKPRLFFIQACRTRIPPGKENTEAGLDEGANIWYYEDTPEEQDNKTHVDKPEARASMPRPKENQNERQASQTGSQINPGPTSVIPPPNVPGQSSTGNDMSSTLSVGQTSEEQSQDVQTITAIARAAVQEKSSTGNDITSTIPAVGEKSQNTQMSTQKRGQFGFQTTGELDQLKFVATGPPIPEITPGLAIGDTVPQSQRVQSQIYPVEMKPFEVTPSLCYPDCLVMFASPPGKTTFGRETEGGWLILSLKKEFDRWAENPERDLMEVLTRVNFEMIKRKTYLLKDKHGNEKEFKVVPCVQHELIKDIRLKARK